jgi:uncharacterized protein YndB with AHSA1/START domain
MTQAGALDLVFERIVDLPAQACFRAWTDPALLTRWFTPPPWRTTAAEVDLRPGGIFRCVMQGPGGEHHDHLGCWLEVAAPHRLVWTDSLQPGFRPAAKPFVTCVLTFDEAAGGTRYRAVVMHATAEDRDRHAAMGFAEGWGKALDQLVALMRAG